MAKDHYMPAAFIGRFSIEAIGSMRKRKVWVHNFRANKIWPSVPEAIGYKKGLYNLANGSDIDKWGYEASLSNILDALANEQPLLLDDYLRVAVPFVTGLFTRGKEFNKRYEELPTIQHLTKTNRINPDNTNGSRAMRLQRMLGPITNARWVVLHSNAQTPIISNDLGLTLTKNLDDGDIGWAIPLDSKTVLGIFPRKMRNIATRSKGMWYANIEHLHPPAEMFTGLNDEIAKSSDEFIFGPTKASVEGITPPLQKSGENLAIIMEAAWNNTFSREEYAAHEKDWQTLSAIANLNLDAEAALTYSLKLDDLDLDHKWFPPLYIIPVNLTSFPSGIGFYKDQVILNLNLIDNFADHVIFPPKNQK